jgi:hypothetical protein
VDPLFTQQLYDRNNGPLDNLKYYGNYSSMILSLRKVAIGVDMMIGSCELESVVVSTNFNQNLRVFFGVERLVQGGAGLGTSDLV